MKKIKYIEIIFENCESVKLNPNMFRALLVKGIQKDYCINCAQYQNGEYWENITCERFHIIINKEGLEKAILSPQFDEKETIENRLKKHKDITHIQLIFSNDKKEYISVPYEEATSFSNNLQFQEFTENGELKIEVGSERT